MLTCKSHEMLWIPHLMASFMAILGTRTLSFKFLQEIFLANVWFGTGTSYIVQMYNVCTSNDEFVFNQMFNFFSILANLRFQNLVSCHLLISFQASSNAGGSSSLLVRTKKG